MSTFLDDKKQLSQEDAQKIISACLKQRVDFISAIGKGANSKVYHVHCSGQQYAAKFYYQHPADPRDRLGVEFKSLSYLWEKGVHAIPRPVTIDLEHSCATYEFIKGTPPGKDITPKDIDGAVDFLGTLKTLSEGSKGQNFQSASEAFFSPLDILNGVKARLKRFTFEGNTEEYLALKEYLHNVFMPLLDMVENQAKKDLIGHGISWIEALSQEYRTLSPSDFGFHNSLRKGNGSIVFLDFEYFGWDDPAKLVSDFLWHPAMALSESLKQRFVDRAQSIFGADPDFQKRLKAFFPVFGLKWCLIFLNEFVDSDMQRRGFAQTAIKDKTSLRLNQLAKAKALSERIRQMHGEFPYGN